MDEPSVSSAETKNANKLSLSLDFRLLCIVLVLIIAVMFALWHPWNPATGASARTISVTGETTLKATPDEFVFYPSYIFKNADKAEALQELQSKQTEVVDGLKKVGVAESAISADSTGNDTNASYNNATQQYEYVLTIKVDINNNKELVQKVQDYLLTTTPSGSVSPSTWFSKTTIKKLESQGRDAAAKDAHAKAEQTAKNLGARLGKVKSIEDNSSQGDIPISSNLASGSNFDTKSTKLTVLPGENEMGYSVTVVYYIK